MAPPLDAERTTIPQKSWEADEHTYLAQQRDKYMQKPQRRSCAYMFIRTGNLKNETKKRPRQLARKQLKVSAHKRTPTRETRERERAPASTASVRPLSRVRLGPAARGGEVLPAAGARVTRVHCAGHPGAVVAEDVAARGHVRGLLVPARERAGPKGNGSWTERGRGVVKSVATAWSWPGAVAVRGKAGPSAAWATSVTEPPTKVRLPGAATVKGGVRS